MTFTRSQEEGIYTNTFQIKFLLDKAKNEHQGNGSDSKVALMDPTREPQSRRKRLEEPNMIFLS